MVNETSCQHCKPPPTFAPTTQELLPTDQQGQGRLAPSTTTVHTAVDYNHSWYKCHHSQGFAKLLAKNRNLTRTTTTPLPGPYLESTTLARANYCETQSRTYLWEHTQTKCELALFKPITARRVGQHHLFSTASQMLLNLTQPYSNLDCGINSGWLTNFDDLIAVPTVPLNAHDVNQDVDWAAALGYLKFELTQHSADLAQQLQQEHCQQGTQDTGITPHHLRGSKYMLTRGDTYLVFTCEPMIGTVKEGTTCYQEVPLTNGLFIVPVS